MRYRLWEIRESQFLALVEHLGFTGKMKDALKSRYDEECAYPRHLTCDVFNITEHGLMKAEKKVLKAHEDFVRVYETKY